MTQAFWATMLVLAPVHAGDSDKKLDLHVVPTPINSYRLLAMSMDDDGIIWAGSVHKAVHRYHPGTGKVDTIAIPYQLPAASSCICVGKKVYILGQTYPRLIVYDRAAKKFSEHAYSSSPRADVWYGTEALDGKHIYLFDRRGAGLIKWDTSTDTPKVIAWPYKFAFPNSGNFMAQDKALWCRIWDANTGKYNPLGIARLDLDKENFTGWYDFPTDDKDLKAFTDPKNTLFLPYTLKGLVVPFDVKERRWCKFLPVPQHGKVFAFMGGPIVHQNRYYFSLSTYNGTDQGCDGQPYHFLNGVLQFDPQARKFEILTLPVKDAYYQMAYMLSAGGDFFVTGNNILDKQGKFHPHDAGDVIFWQTRKLNK